MLNYLSLIDGTDFSVNYYLNKEILHLGIQGRIDEDSDLSSIIELANQSRADFNKVSFDVSSVNRINSCGVRAWLLFIERIQSMGQCEFAAVSEAFVEYANMVPNVFGKKGTPVHSFAAPFLCTSCNSRKLETLRPSDVKKEGPISKVSAPNCANCAKPMEFDAIEEEYFAFLDNQ